MSDNPSSPIRLLSLVWEAAQTATGHSWLRLNHAMPEALSLAIRSGMEFDLGDWGKPMERFRPGYWRQTESHYKLAVLYRNASAWKSIEHALKRKPFVIAGASCNASGYGDGRMGQGLSRIVIGAEFPWDGRSVTVTSINDDKGCLVACAYKPWTKDDQDRCPTCSRIRNYQTDRKPVKQYKITHADIKAARKGAKL